MLTGRVGQEVTYNEVACFRTHLVCIEVVRFVGALLGVEQQLHDHSQHVAPREALLRLNSIKVRFHILTSALLGDSTVLGCYAMLTFKWLSTLRKGQVNPKRQLSRRNIPVDLNPRVQSICLKC